MLFRSDFYPAAAPTSVPTGQSPVSVMVVDDDDDLRSTIQMLLEQAGHRVFAANNGSKAIKLLGVLQGQINVILLDYMMPGMDGAQTLAYLRELHPTAKVVLISGADELRLRQAFVEKGADFCLHKPLAMNQLLETIQRAAQ